MLAVLRHRGPDDSGVHDSGGAVIGAVRLAVLDPERGAQPMSTPDGRHVLVWNGEITNHTALRDELARAGVEFRTRCDTEVLLHLLAREGVAGLAHANGMFAGALLDTVSGELTLFRDPCGIKPLYVAMDGQDVLFASEPRGLLAAMGPRPAVDRLALLDYLSYQLPLTTRTLFEGVERVPPGTVLSFARDRAVVTSALPAWPAPGAIPGTRTEAAEMLGGILASAVREHLRSDVPVGAHLSGGTDSSLVCALAAPHVDGPLQVFTGAFDEARFDERRHARAVAAEIGARLHEVVISPDDLMESLPSAIGAMDEPLAGPGLLAQWCVARAARDHVTVVLGGQGGDELFGGYVRHLVLRLGAVLADLVHGGDTLSIRDLAPHLGALDGYGPLLRRTLSGGLTQPAPDRYFSLLFRGAGLDSLISGDLAEALRAHDARGRFLAAFGECASGREGTTARVADAMRFDRRHVLPALLEVEDRTSMAFSLESRVPLLDRRVLAFVDALPDEWLVGDGEPKGVLRAAAGERLPAAARTRRDKMGFPVPLANWARGPLRAPLRDLLLGGALRERGFVQADAVDRMLDGASVEARHLWALLNLELWHRRHAA